MDVVYILNKESQSNDDELMFSLRSLQKYMTDLGKVFIVGDCPDWIHNVIHIPAKDEYSERWKNCMHKVTLACKDDRLSDDFIFMNDDFYATDYFIGAELPFYSIKGRDGGVNGPNWFECHRPMRFNKECFLKMPINVLSPGHWFPKTFYANFYKATPTPCKEIIIATGQNMKPFLDQIGGENWFSLGRVTILDPFFRNFIAELYPEPSNFE